MSRDDGTESGFEYLMEQHVESPDIEEFDFLGYDVADSGLISALSNCGWCAADKARAVAKWKEKLNPNHLFRDFNPAVEFVEFSDVRVEEHAPFYVYGIWMRR